MNKRVGHLYPTEQGWREALEIFNEIGAIKFPVRSPLQSVTVFAAPGWFMEWQDVALTPDELDRCCTFLTDVCRGTASDKFDVEALAVAEDGGWIATPVSGVSITWCDGLMTSQADTASTPVPIFMTLEVLRWRTPGVS